MIRVVIADDHPVFRYGLQAILESAEGIEIVGQAVDGRELLDIAARTGPDVVITDIRMPELDGVAATRELRRLLPAVAVLVLTMHEDDETVIEALRAGALGYIVKGADGTEIVRAVQSAAAGTASYGGAVAARIVDFFTGAQADYASRVFPDLTPRERDVLGLLATGCGNLEIARRLGLSEKTVRNHVSAVLTKLQAPDRATAVARAREAGLGTR